MKLLLQISIFITFCLLFGCSANLDKKVNTSENITPEIIYKEALIELDKKNYDLALEKFNIIETNYPLSNEAIQSQIMTAFVNYLSLRYELAITKLNKIIRRYPSYKNIDYVYYMKALCYYEQIDNPELDGKYNILALKSFEESIERFPNSKYSKDSYQKIVLIKENIAAKHMNIGMFYLKQKKYLAAMKRYNKVIDDHSKTKYVPEALHRLAEIYYSLGMLEDANKTASVLGFNFPNSKWYKYSFKMLKGKNL